MSTTDTSGFYKVDGVGVLFAPNFVVNESYTLDRTVTADHSRQVDGWAWFDSSDLAYKTYGVTPPQSPIRKK